MINRIGEREREEHEISGNGETATTKQLMCNLKFYPELSLSVRFCFRRPIPLRRSIRSNCIPILIICRGEKGERVSSASGRRRGAEKSRYCKQLIYFYKCASILWPCLCRSANRACSTTKSKWFAEQQSEEGDRLAARATEKKKIPKKMNAKKKQQLLLAA